MLFCLTDENYIQIECLEEKLLTIKVWKIGQISCVHKPYFLMLGHIYAYIHTYTYTYIIAICISYNTGKSALPDICAQLSNWPLSYNMTDLNVYCDWPQFAKVRLYITTIKVL